MVPGPTPPLGFLLFKATDMNLEHPPLVPWATGSQVMVVLNIAVEEPWQMERKASGIECIAYDESEPMLTLWRSAELTYATVVLAKLYSYIRSGPAAQLPSCPSVSIWLPCRPLRETPVAVALVDSREHLQSPPIHISLFDLTGYPSTPKLGFSHGYHLKVTSKGLQARLKLSQKIF